MYCEQGSLCFEMAKGLPAAFVAFVIGGIAAYIAWRQHETAKAKLKLDLFDKRFAVFEQTWKFLSETIQSASELTLNSDFTNVIPQASFLFGPDVETYLRDISSKRTDLWVIYAKMKSSGDVMVPEDISRHTELMAWFHDEASKGAKQVFTPWLNFHDWK
jgi:hypothetical protein